MKAMVNERNEEIRDTKKPKKISDGKSIPKKVIAPKKKLERDRERKKTMVNCCTAKSFFVFFFSWLWVHE